MSYALNNANAQDSCTGGSSCLDYTWRHVSRSPAFVQSAPFAISTAHTVAVYKRRLTGRPNSAGALAAAIVGSAAMYGSYAIGGLITAFFLSSSILTRLAAPAKLKADSEYKKGGQRDWRQVAANGFVPAVLALAAAIVASWIFVPFLAKACDPTPARIGSDAPSCARTGGAAVAARSRSPRAARARTHKRLPAASR